MFGGPKLEDMIFQLRFTTKQLERHAKKAEKEMNVQKTKCKKELQKGNRETAAIYAENAIRKKNESLNYLRYASRVDAVSCRVQSAATMKEVTRSMGTTVKALEAALSSMNLEKVQKVMDKFESTFEDLDVQSGVMEQSMGQATTLSAPEDQVTALMKQVAEENGLEIATALPSVEPTALESVKAEEDVLSTRLRALRE